MGDGSQEGEGPRHEQEFISASGRPPRLAEQERQSGLAFGRALLVLGCDMLRFLSFFYVPIKKIAYPLALPFNVCRIKTVKGT